MAALNQTRRTGAAFASLDERPLAVGRLRSPVRRHAAFALAVDLAVLAFCDLGLLGRHASALAHLHGRFAFRNLGALGRHAAFALAPLHGRFAFRDVRAFVLAGLHAALARGHEPWRASLRLGRLVALLRAANGLVQEYTANADADANAATAATAATPATTTTTAAAMMPITAHAAGKSRCRAGGAYDEEQPQGRSD